MSSSVASSGTGQPPSSSSSAPPLSSKKTLATANSSHSIGNTSQRPPPSSASSSSSVGGVGVGSTPKTGTPTAADDAAVDAAASSGSKKLSANRAAPSFSFPPPVSDPTPNLAPLRDEHSSFPVVAKTCLQLTQYAGHGSSTHIVEDNVGYTTTSSALFHDASYAKIMSNIFAALMECLRENEGRRCRIIAAKTAAVVARSAYARLRPSPLLFAVRDPISHRLEDEAGTEIPTALITAALKDPDDGVSSSAVEAVGMMTLSTHSSGCLLPSYATTAADVLLTREIQALSTGAHRVQMPYAPTLRAVADEDVSVPQAELTNRIFENVVAPRMLQLLERVTQYLQSGGSTNAAASEHVGRVLPTITACLLHLIHTSPAQLFVTDRTTFSKRWLELDVPGLVDTTMQALILPSLRSTATVSAGTDGSLSAAAALAGLRLWHACGSAAISAPWGPTVVQWAVVALQEQVTASTNLEHKMTSLAAFVIATRAVPLHIQRTALLTWMAEEMVLTGIPWTMTAPAGISSTAALRVEWQNYVTLRYPARMALWTEIALSFFIDGPTSSQEVSAASSTSTSTMMPPTDAPAATVPVSSSSSSRRADCLKVFLSTPCMANLLSNTALTSDDSKQRDEVLLAFASVAVEAGRRFRVAADGSLLLVTTTSATATANPSSAASTSSGSSNTSGGNNPIIHANTSSMTQVVLDWMNMAWVVLTSFCPSVNAGPKPVYLEEDLSLITAGLASYVQLLQEYLHFVGLLHPSTSASIKLTANACTPHIVWDKLSESGSFLTKLENTPNVVSVATVEGLGTSLSYQDATTKLMDEIVVREKKQGIPSHHMRLYLLSLASDHWLQCRALNLRQQQPDGAGNAATLNVNSGREIVAALSPKRLLSKIFESHAPPADDDHGRQKRDPVKKLALETVRLAAACIENVSLAACDWRRRFGSSSECKHLVSVCVGVLQGKGGDDVPSDERIKSTMAPLCDAAVNRIQTFYESDSGNGHNNTESTPLSELLLQPVKTKIKPLVSSSRPQQRPHDEFMLGYLTQLCRQIVAARIMHALQSSPPADSLLSLARPTHWLRLSVPPLPESRDSRMYGSHGDALAAWGKSVATATASSDPAQMVIAYTPRRFCRYDGEDEYRLAILMRVFNMTAVDMFEGLRLELGIVHENQSSLRNALNDPMSLDMIGSLGSKPEDFSTDIPLISSAVVYKQEVKSGEYITWELALDRLPETAGLALLPSIVYRNVKIEPEEAGAKWIGDQSGDGAGDASTQGGESNSGEDDFQVKSSNRDSGNASGDEPETDNITLAGELLPICPMIGFQPCPLVFFRDRWGDVDSFRFMWFRMPFQLAPLKLTHPSPDQVETSISPTVAKVAMMSSLTWDGEAIPGGYATKLWAFLTVSGYRVLGVLAESESDNLRKATLHLRGNNKSALYALAGTKEARHTVVAALVPGMLPIG